MIRSMTGFGKASENSPFGKITAEIKSLNHKNLSIACNPFNGFFLLEEQVKDIFSDKIYRGKIFIKITREGASGKQALKNIEVNEVVAKEYLKKIKKAQERLGVKGEIGIKELINLPGVMENAPRSKEEKLWPYIKKALLKALEKLIDFRKSEGKRLAKDFKQRLAAIGEKIKDINRYGKQGVGEYRKKLLKSIKEISEKTELDKGKLESEVALFARNCDIAEEVTRLEGHIEAYNDAMKKVKTDVGKKLDFIAQEMQREANTIGSKSGDLRIAKAVIDVKSEIEKMREQIKNIE